MYYTSSTPVSEVLNHGSSTRLFEIVAVLCQASQGSIALVGALRRISSGLDADIVSLCRIQLQMPDASTKVIAHEARRRLAEDAGPFQVSFAHGVCGAHLGQALPGSVWIGKASDFEDQPRLSSIFRHRALEETVIIPLGSRNGFGDFLELHFSRPVPKALLSQLDFMGPVMADCWKARALGLFSDAVMSHRRQKMKKSINQPILSAQNPCGLSRSEYRICVLLSNGLNNHSLLEELSITMTTLRSHLRNIYAKTECMSQPELLHRLLASSNLTAVRRYDDADVA